METAFKARLIVKAVARGRYAMIGRRDNKPLTLFDPMICVYGRCHAAQSSDRSAQRYLRYVLEFFDYKDL